VDRGGGGLKNTAPVSMDWMAEHFFKKMLCNLVLPWIA
jgi:hypothetical protein